MNIELTHLSEEEYRKLRSRPLTPAMAARYLREGQIALRSFGDTLREMYPAHDLQGRLVHAFAQANAGVSLESIARRVRNWMADQNRPTAREDVFIMAFGLGLSEDQTSLLLGLCTDYGIHYRDGRDVVYAWFLRTGGSYAEARDFFASLPPAPRYALPPEDGRASETHELQQIFLRVQDREGLREAYLTNLDRFGALHARAYRYFERYLNQLIHPAPAWAGAEEADYSLEAVMRVYLSLRMPSGRARSDYNVVQKLIKRSWPNATSLKNIRSRREDVPRKLLLLLYVITENVIDEEYSELDEEYMTVEDRLEDHWWALNAMLTDCGMPPMDPRNATDWLILYAVSAVDEPMSERMEKTIEYIFADE